MPTPTISALTAPSIRKNGISLFHHPTPSILPPLQHFNFRKPQHWHNSFFLHSSLFAGKHWHTPKSAFRPRAGQSSYSARVIERKALEATKAKEKEMKEEKETERQVFHTYIYLSIYLSTKYTRVHTHTHIHTQKETQKERECVWRRRRRKKRRKKIPIKRFTFTNACGCVSVYVETDSSYQGQTRCQGGEGEVWENGGDDA